RRQRFLAGAQASDLGWFTPAGTVMTGDDWSNPNALSLALYLDGADAPDRAAGGTPMLADDFLVLVNGWWEPLAFVIPPTRPGATWQLAIDSYDPTRPASAAPVSAGGTLPVGPRSIAVLRGPIPG